MCSPEPSIPAPAPGHDHADMSETSTAKGVTTLACAPRPIDPGVTIALDELIAEASAR